MKLVTLNVWGGKLYEPLIQFIKEKSVDMDVFCFQDVLFGSNPEFTEIQKGRINLFSEIEKVLTDFHSVVYRDPEESYFHGELLPLDIGCGQTIYVRKSIQIIENGGFRSHPDSPYHKGGDMVSGRCQWIKLQLPERENLTILNLHGLWQRNTNKADTPERIEQSKKINDFFNSVKGKKILCGDFNIIPNGQAMSIFENGMINLVKEYKISTTRSSHYPKEEKFADYALTSKDTTVNDFKVLPDVVSDHLALLVDFN